MLLKIHKLTVYATKVGDKNYRVRQAAAEALGQIGDATAVPALIEHLTDSSQRYWHRDERVCEVAAEALKRIGTPEPLEAVETWRQSQSEQSKAKSF